MKKAFTLVNIFFCLTSFSQDQKLYNPQADAAADILAVVKKAAEENKFLLIQGGGNWCGW